MVFTSKNQKEGFLGILMLDTAFPRILGDAGNVESYDVPARIKIVKNAESQTIVRDSMPSEELINAFCDAARQLEDLGATAIVSTCGFLVTIQKQVSEAVKIPVMLSSLSLYPSLSSLFGERPIGILTASKTALGTTALHAANVSQHENLIAGMEDCASFSNIILAKKDDQEELLDSHMIERFAVRQAEHLLHQTPTIAAFLLECGNLPPYSQAIKQATGKPVFSILDGARMLYRS